MKLEVKSNCPLNDFKPCKQFDCAWFIQVRGTNPQTGQEVDEYACSMAWVPLLMIENSQQQRQTGAAIESFRNEMVKANKSSLALLTHSANLRLKNE
ncbi:TPA: hypothetical protein JAG59_002022 [Legionella pneumophila]|nr:hypothetical protein [Legionella pneumophila]HAT5918716.1 hypothetical protein [Legionella pneumophila]HAT5922961.1 hypothetical protein [Legionella pneumophila]HAT5934487.1 hypothetical protein [Legionella pneumophila]HAT5950239.1 hypothetical protein [Legionella pneumophila]